MYNFFCELVFYSENRSLFSKKIAMEIMDTAQGNISE